MKRLKKILIILPKIIFTVIICQLIIFMSIFWFVNAQNLLSDSQTQLSIPLSFVYNPQPGSQTNRGLSTFITTSIYLPLVATTTQTPTISQQNHLIFLPLIVKNAGIIQCDFTIPLTTGKADGRTSYSEVKPGNTVCIMGGTRDDLILANFEGTNQRPIRFINKDGKVIINSTTSHGIIVQNSRYFRLSGGEEAGEYGIKINTSQGQGVRVGHKSNYFEVDHIEVTGTRLAGIYAHTTPVCSDGSTNNYDYDNDGEYLFDLDDVVNQFNFIQRDWRIHDNYIHDTGTEGFYIGNSFFGGIETLTCDRGQETMYPPVIIGIEVYNNIVHNTGWDGLQVSSAIDSCLIHHNQIQGDSQAAKRYQESGIFNGRGSTCNIYNNFIKDGGGPGIYVFGDGHNYVYNNVIINPGENNADLGNGITVGEGSNPGNSIYVWHNTIVNPVAYGINFFNDQGNDNKIQNNIIVNPGKLDTEGSDAYVRTGARTNVVASNNLSEENLSEVKFTDPQNDDYSLRSTSPAVDQGLDLSSQGIDTDYLDTHRPRGLKSEIGAYEF